jgi:hypothetical protein
MSHRAQRTLRFSLTAAAESHSVDGPKMPRAFRSGRRRLRVPPYRHRNCIGKRVCPRSDSPHPVERHHHEPLHPTFAANLAFGGRYPRRRRRLSSGTPTATGPKDESDAGSPDAHAGNANAGNTDAGNTDAGNVIDRDANADVGDPDARDANAGNAGRSGRVENPDADSRGAATAERKSPLRATRGAESDARHAESVPNTDDAEHDEQVDAELHQPECFHVASHGQ